MNAYRDPKYHCAWADVEESLKEYPANFEVWRGCQAALRWIVAGSMAQDVFYTRCLCWPTYDGFCTIHAEHLSKQFHERQNQPKPNFHVNADFLRPRCPLDPAFHVVRRVVLSCKPTLDEQESISHEQLRILATTHRDLRREFGFIGRHCLDPNPIKFTKDRRSTIR